MEIGDTVYVVRHHIKNHKNIGYYIDKCRVCDFSNSYFDTDEYHKYIYVDHNLNSLEDIPNKRAKRMYCRKRVHKSLEEAQKECDLKNKIISIRNKYKEEIEKIKNDLYEEN